MFSLPKILVLVAIVVAVWYGFKLLNRRGLGGVFRGSRDTGADGAPKALEMEKCARCGDFVAPGARACAKADCPYPAP